MTELYVMPTHRPGVRWFVGGGIAFAVGIGLAVTSTTVHPVVVPAVDQEEAQALLTGSLRAEWAAVEARASTLAQLPRLATAIMTDEATVHDLTADELAFTVRADETVQLAQEHPDGMHVLLRLPTGAAPVSLVMGKHLAFADGQVELADAIPIRSGTMSGALAIRWRVPAPQVFDELAATPGVRLVIDGQAIALGAPLAAGARTVTLPIKIAGATTATIEVPATESTSATAGPLRAGALGAGVVGLMLGALGWVRRRRPLARAVTEPPSALPPPIPDAAVQPVAAIGSARLGTGGGAGTTSSTRLGRYEPTHLLGTGGTSSVFLARSLGDEGFEKKVALKVLNADLSHQDGFREMFLDEARLAAQINHPNVIEIFDLGRSGDELYIAMEHIDGDDLESLLSYQRAMERATPLPIALAILRRVCDGLHAAHTAIDVTGAPLNLVHRDVKPGNVMISRNGEVKVGDFGIAKASQQLHVSNAGETKGTVQFMAPEQRMGRAVDARTDVFGVGAIAYELITGVTLDLDLARLLKHGLVGWPHLTPIAQLRPEAPAELQRLLFAALAYEADDRPESCAILESELGAIMAAEGWNVGKRELARWLAGELALRTTRATTAMDTVDELTLIAARPS